MSRAMVSEWEWRRRARAAEAQLEYANRLLKSYMEREREMERQLIETLLELEVQS